MKPIVFLNRKWTPVRRKILHSVLLLTGAGKADDDRLSSWNELRGRKLHLHACSETPTLHSGHQRDRGLYMLPLPKHAVGNHNGRQSCPPFAGYCLENRLLLPHLTDWRESWLTYLPIHRLLTQNENFYIASQQWRRPLANNSQQHSNVTRKAITSP